MHRHHHPGKPSHLDSDQSLLEMLTSTVACLKQKNMDLEALGCLEQSLWLKRRMFGVDNSVVQRALNDVVLSYNAVAMQYLAQAQFDQCLAMLRKAEAITAPGNFRKCQSLQILTFNNIGCCYRKLGKLKSALKYLKEAAQLGATCAHVKNLSITHLNLCAIQSQLGRHDLALEHAQAAIFHTQEELVSLEAAVNSGRRADDDDDCGDGSATDVLDAKSREEKIISLAVAYHNLAVELEFNGRGDASLQWYKKALQLVWKYRESNAALCASFKKIFFDAKKKLELQRSGSAGVHLTNRPAASGGRTAPQHVATAATASNDRRKPMARPQSAHHSSRSGGDLSYSANVASQCYKPLKPSAAGLQYASPPRGRTSADCAARRDFGALSGSSKAQRATPSSCSSSRQRPLSASALRPAAAKDSGTNIEARWKRLEREFALEDAGVATNASAQPANSRASQQQSSRATKRLQSAHPTTHVGSSATHQRPSQRHDLDTFAVHCSANISDLEDDDEDCDVLDDDELSESEDAPTEKSDGFADLLLRRGTETHTTAQANSEQQSSRGHRHHQALDAARCSQNDESDALSAPVDDSLATSDDGDGELPNQRVSHMEYLRRMKRLAENIKDDLAGAPAPAAAFRPGSASRRAAPPPSQAPTGKPAAKGSSATSSASQEEEAAMTPRGSTSKVRERLERMRSDSCQSLPGYDEDAGQGSEPESSPSPELAEQFIEVVENENDSTEQGLGAAELKLVQRAAAKRVQAFVRGERARAEVRRTRQACSRTCMTAVSDGDNAHASLSLSPQELREQELELQSREPLSSSRQNVPEGAEESALQLGEVEHVAARVIQVQFRRRFLDGPPLPSPPSSPSPTPSEPPSKPERRPSVTPEPLERSPDTRRRSAAAVRIQASMKGHVTREIVSEHRAALLSRMYVERKHAEVALHQAVRCSCRGTGCTYVGVHLTELANAGERLRRWRWSKRSWRSSRRRSSRR